MAIEGDGNRRERSLASGLHGATEDRAVTEVDAVEEADRDDRAIVVRRQGVEPLESFHRTEGNGRPNGPSRRASVRDPARTCRYRAVVARNPRRSDAAGS